MFKLLRDQIVLLGQMEEGRQLAQPNQDPALNGLDAVSGFYRLARDYQEVLLLVALEGLRYEETADVLNVPLETVRSRLSQARASLRDGDQRLSEDSTGY